MQAFIVELPNQPGSLARVCEALGARGINISAFAGATAGEVGSLAFTAMPVPGPCSTPTAGPPVRWMSWSPRSSTGPGRSALPPDGWPMPV